MAAPIEAAAAANLLSPDAQAVAVAQQTGSISQTISGTADATSVQDAEISQSRSADPADGTSGSTSGDTSTGGATTGTSGGVQSLLDGGSLLSANVNVDADANLTAPVAGAVAANANVAAPVDAAVAANVASPDASAQAVAVQNVQISQNLDDVSATANAEQDAKVEQ